MPQPVEQAHVDADCRGVHARVHAGAVGCGAGAGGCRRVCSRGRAEAGGGAAIVRHPLCRAPAIHADDVARHAGARSLPAVWAVQGGYTLQAGLPHRLRVRLVRGRRQRDCSDRCNQRPAARPGRLAGHAPPPCSPCQRAAGCIRYAAASSASTAATAATRPAGQRRGQQYCKPRDQRYGPWRRPCGRAWRGLWLFGRTTACSRAC
mmetsp:Transcript_84341/g.252935  ORF Transcript_84341/g.252935 Transcript_84341/m.252935 type:complete len:206 (+) Transcript_84341:1494-2111(+)